ncbi:hypothetical protein [Leucobacter luti]|uniref:Uncharacterized protein n=1 Tax=Leucobacter luti TaxID=340320 RepID=A0A4R6S5H5_9MICO|nr:hypothetical protein [Leucobacter luti]QYM76705.1 hypothetical protein K1X41_04650 [Leucobacter luti]TDP94417.1 hypothetical protein EDF62_0832 [Leucobacter luti]
MDLTSLVASSASDSLGSATAVGPAHVGAAAEIGGLVLVVVGFAYLICAVSLFVRRSRSRRVLSGGATSRVY